MCVVEVTIERKRCVIILKHMRSSTKREKRNGYVLLSTEMVSDIRGQMSVRWG